MVEIIHFSHRKANISILLYMNTCWASHLEVSPWALHNGSYGAIRSLLPSIPSALWSYATQVYEWLTFHSTFLNIHRSNLHAALFGWCLVPHETPAAAISVHGLCTTMHQFTASVYSKPHTQGVAFRSIKKSLKVLLPLQDISSLWLYLVHLKSQGYCQKTRPLCTWSG